MEVESLVISMGVDLEKLMAGLSRAQQAVNVFVDQTERFSKGFADGFDKASAGVQNTATVAKSASSSIRNVGKEATEAAAKGQAGMAKLETATAKVGAKAEEASGRFHAMGEKWGGLVGELLKKVAGPLAAAFSIKSVFTSYTDDIAQVAQMTGQYSGQVEELRKKQALLQRVNKEDIELYKKGKLAITDFSIAMAGLSTSIMRSVSPAIQKGLDLLSKVSQWVGQNQPSIIRFITVLAGTIAAVLIPTFTKLAAAMLANPITWLIAGIMGIAIVIDDLVTYIHGGETAFGSFWAMFGTGAEVAEKLGRAWENLKAIGSSLWSGLKNAAQVFWDYFGGVFPPILDALAAAIRLIADVLNGDFSAAFDEAINIVRALVNVLRNVLGGALNAVTDVLVGVANKVAGLFSGVPGALESARAAIVGVLETIAGAVGSIAESVRSAISDAFGSIAGAVGSIASVVAHAFDAVPEFITAPFQAAADAVTAIWEKVVEWFKSLPDRILAAIGDLSSLVGDKIMGALSGVANFFGFNGDNKNQNEKPVQSTTPSTTPKDKKPWSNKKEQSEVNVTVAQQSMVPGNVVQAAATTMPTNEQLTQAGSDGKTSNVDRSKTTNIDSTINMTINSSATNANELAQNLAPAMKSKVSSVYAVDSGVMQ